MAPGFIKELYAIEKIRRTSGWTLQDFHAYGEENARPILERFHRYLKIEA